MLLPEEERTQQVRYLDHVEPACNSPIDGRDEEGAILSAIAKDDPSTLRSAAREGFDFNRLLDGRNPPIVLAAIKGSSEMVAVLAAGGAKADSVGADGRTALDHLFSDLRGPPARRTAVIRALLEAGADANRPDIWGFPPIIRAADVEMLELLLKHDARIDQPVACHGCSAQGWTVSNGRPSGEGPPSHAAPCQRKRARRFRSHPADVRSIAGSGEAAAGERR